MHVTSVNANIVEVVVWVHVLAEEWASTSKCKQLVTVVASMAIGTGLVLPMARDVYMYYDACKLFGLEFIICVHGQFKTPISPSNILSTFPSMHTCSQTFPHMHIYTALHIHTRMSCTMMQTSEGRHL